MTGALRDAVRATAVSSGIAGGALAAVENVWLASTRELAFTGGLDRLSFVLGASAVEALVASGAGAALAALAGLWRRPEPGEEAAFAIPIAAWLATARALPALDALLSKLPPRSVVIADAGLLALALALAAWLHVALRGRVRAPGLARARLGRGLAALAAVAVAGAGTALVLAGRPPAPFGTPSGRRDAAPSLVLPEGTPVILILVDTLRADHLSYAGYRRDTSPTVDRLAREGVVFERVIAQATRTSPNMASLLTGTGPATHGLVAAQSRLEQNLVTWGEILAGHGYETASILGNPNMGHRFEFTQGMQHVDEAFSEPDFDAGVLLPRGLAWLAERGRDPYFLWIHAIDPHSPYAAPGPARDRYQADETHRAGPSDALPLTESRFGGVYPEARLPEARSLSDYVARYDAEIRFFDEALAAFLSGLDVERGVPPLIVFTSDHGESLGEHDYFFSHGNFTHDATARVPLVFHHPRLPAGLRVPRMVRTIDVLPTVLELLGFDVPPSVEGRSLVPLIAGGSLDAEPAVIFAGFPERIEAAVRDERYKLIARPLHAGLFDRWATARLRAWPSPRRTSPLQGPRYELHLYDLAADPGETANLYGQLPDVELALRSHLLAYVDNHKGPATNRRVADQELSDEMREQLRALGYVE